MENFIFWIVYAHKIEKFYFVLSVLAYTLVYTIKCILHWSEFRGHACLQFVCVCVFVGVIHFKCVFVCVCTCACTALRLTLQTKCDTGVYRHSCLCPRNSDLDEKSNVPASGLTVTLMLWPFKLWLAEAMSARRLLADSVLFSTSK